MNTTIRETLEPIDNDFVVDFETEKTPVKLGKSDKYFYMDFNDTNFPVRLIEGRDEIADFLMEKRKEIDNDNIDLASEEKHSFEDVKKMMAITNEIDQFVKAKINYMFGYDISSIVFGVASSMSITKNGEYYFDSFLNSLLPLVEREYQVRLNATNARIKKYTDKKGLHPAFKK